MNLLTYSYGLNNVKKDDKIVLSIMEHHSNLVPWQMVCQKNGAKLEYMYTNSNGELTTEEIDKKIVPGVKIVGITQVSNVLGTINPIKEIIKKANLKETSLSTLAKTIDIANTNDFVQFFIDLER